MRPFLLSKIGNEVMYALKLMTEREGRKVEEVHCLGEMY